jgi:hypothetical protein
MPGQFFLGRAALLLRGARLISGRSFCSPLRATRDGSLRSHGLRLRLYGVSEAGDARMVAARLTGLLADKPCRWRIVCVDADGTLAVLVRVAGVNVAAPLLREGLVSLRGFGTRRLRVAQDAARRERCGIWCLSDDWQMPAA